MNIKIPYQTGNFELSARIITPIQISNFSFGLLCTGFAEKTLSIQAENGELFNSSGIIFGGYNDSNEINFKAVVRDNDCSIFLDDNLVISEELISKDTSHFFFDKDNNNLSYDISLNMRGWGTVTPQKIIYITNNQEEEQKIIDIVSAIADEVIVEDSTYIPTSSDLEEVNLFIFGYSQDEAIFAMPEYAFWATNTNKKIFLNTLILRQGYLDLIYSFGSFAPSESDRGEFFGNNYFKRVEEINGKVILFDNEYDIDNFATSGKIIVNSGADLASILTNYKILQPPYLEFDVFDKVTDNWKKSFISMILDDLDSRGEPVIYGIGNMRIGYTFRVF